MTTSAKILCVTMEILKQKSDRLKLTGGQVTVPLLSGACYGLGERRERAVMSWASSPTFVTVVRVWSTVPTPPLASPSAGMPRDHHRDLQ